MLDLNSASPAPGACHLRRRARRAQAALRRGAVTSVPPPHQRCRCCSSGPDAGRWRRMNWDYAARIASPALGIGQRHQMCRVTVKGLGRWSSGSFTAARHCGVEDTVIASPRSGIDWAPGRLLLPARHRARGARRSEEGARGGRHRRGAGPRRLERGWHRRTAGPVAGLADRGVFGERGTAPTRAAPTEALRPTTSRPSDTLARREPSAEMDFCQDPGWLDWYAPQQSRVACRRAAPMPHCHVFGPAPSSRSRPSASTRPAMHRRQQLYALRDHLGFARNVVVQATCHGADNRAMVGCLPSSGGKARAAWPPSRAASTRRRAAGAARGGAACASTSSSGWWTSRPRRADGDRGRIAGLAGTSSCISEAVDRPRAVGFLHGRPHRGGRPWAGRRESQPVDGPGVRAVLKFMREHANVEQLPERLSVTGPKALDGEQSAYLPTWCRSRAVSSRVPRPRARGTDWPHPNLKTTCRRRLLVDFIPAHRADARAAAQAAGRQPDAPVLAEERSDDGLDKPYKDIPATIFDAEQGAIGLLAQPVLHVAPDEGGQPRALQGRRARLPRQMADDRGAAAGRARARPEPLHRTGGKYLLPAKIGATDG